MEAETDTRTKRVPLLLTQAERDSLEAAAKTMGLGLSTFIRVKALEATRADARTQKAEGEAA